MDLSPSGRRYTRTRCGQNSRGPLLVPHVHGLWSQPRHALRRHRRQVTAANDSSGSEQRIIWPPKKGTGHARAGINFADTMARIGLYPDAPKLLSFSETRSESARPHDGPGFSDPQDAD